MNKRLNLPFTWG